MKERGILFTKENRCKVINGSKTQTRRVITPQPEKGHHAGLKCTVWYYKGLQIRPYKENPFEMWYPFAPYQVGDRLYMLEPYQILRHYPGDYKIVGVYLDDKAEFSLNLCTSEYRKFDARKRPHMRTSSRFMYKSLARYWFEVTAIRVQWVQDISKEDVKAEGVIIRNIGETWWRAFHNLWDSINKKRGYGWDKNPFVWAYEYKRIEVKNG